MKIKTRKNPSFYHFIPFPQDWNISSPRCGCCGVRSVEAGGLGNPWQQLLVLLEDPLLGSVQHCLHIQESKVSGGCEIRL